MEYEDHLDRKFAMINIFPSPLVQIYLTYKANDEAYTLKKMLQQLNRSEFHKEMEKKLFSLFKKEIWETVPK